MIKITRQNWYGWLIALILLATLLCGFARAVECKGFGSGEAAGWMQAIGAVVSIWAAIWLAGKGERERHRKERIVAILAAAEHWTLLRKLSDEIQRFNERFVITVGGGSITEGALRELAAWSKSCHKLSSEDILKLSGLGSDCAENIARVNADIFAVGVATQGILDTFNPGPDIMQHEFRLLKLHVIISRANTHMTAAMSEIGAAVKPKLLVEPE